MRKSGQRLAELERGRRIALAAESVRRLKTGHGLAGPSGATALADAEATLRRLRERQAEDAAAESAYETFDAQANPAGIAERLEAAGFGQRTRPTAASVLERLRQKTGATAACRLNRNSTQPQLKTRKHVMNPQIAQGSPHSAAWITFTYASFVASVGMVGIGVLFAPVDIWIKAYFAMGAALLVQSCITMTKTLRDVHEGSRMVNRIEDARAERLLMEIERGKE